jgi:hypothetical protein
MTMLMGLQFKINYRKGRDNIVVDALSRVSSLMVTQACSEVIPTWIHEVINSYATQTLLTQLAITSPNEHGYSLHQGIIIRGAQIWIGENSALRTKLISTFHDTPLGATLVYKQHTSGSRNSFTGKVLKEMLTTL